MRIILISADDDKQRVCNMVNYLKSNYNIRYVYYTNTKRASYTKKLLKNELTASFELVKNLDVKKNYTTNYEETKHLLKAIDLSTRSDLYKQIFENSQSETDEQLTTKLRKFYIDVLYKKSATLNTNSYESLNLSKNNDIAVISDHYTANSIVEAVYRINKFHAYCRTEINNINKIHANISVINTGTDLLEFYNYSNFDV